MTRRVDFVWLEGQLEETVSRRLLNEASLDTSRAVFKIAGGQDAFWSRVRDYDVAARRGLLIVGLADLERETCVGGLLARHLPGERAKGLILRIAVRTIESWLLADREGMAGFLHAPVARLPAEPDCELHPKRTLVQIARRYAPAGLKKDLVPAPGHSGLAGPGYRPRMAAFIVEQWHPQAARCRSPSLDRALCALEKLSAG